MTLALRNYSIRNRNRWRKAAAVAGIVFGLFPAARAATPIGMLLRKLGQARRLSQAAIAPNGDWVAWIEALPGKNGEITGMSRIQLIRTAHASHIYTLRVNARPAGYSSLAWSPNSRELAFLSTAASPGQAQIFVSRISARSIGKPARITRLQGDLGDLHWSPGGKRIGFLYIHNALRAAGPLQPMTPPSGVIESHIYEQRLMTAAWPGGQIRAVSPPHLYVYQYGWSPRGRQFVISAAYGNGDANWWIARLYTLNSHRGGLRLISRPAWQIAQPRWSPDGKKIAFISGIMSDEGSTGGDLFLAPASGGRAKDITPHLHASITSFHWLNARQILLSEDRGGAAALARLELKTRKIQPIWRGPVSMSAGGWNFGVSLANDGVHAAMIQASFRRPPELWAGRLGHWRQITRVNAKLRPAWGRVVDLHWRHQAYRLQGWLMLPRHYHPDRKYPLVVSVHGGPGAANTPDWPGTFYNTSLLSHEGFFVFYPNPRGSFGQGEAFARANIKDFGYGDFQDILAGVKYITRHYPVDPRRLGITGWSYGGYMTMWAVTQTHMFRAAVAGAGLADWLSYYGENDIDQWMIPYFGASVYDDPGVYARSAPMTFIKNAKTPTLILVGDRDGECPTPQSFEFWRALRTLGVPTELVVYKDEGHYIWRPSDQRDIVRRQIAWFEKYLR